MAASWRPELLRTNQRTALLWRRGMLDELIQYLSVHPGVMTAIGITAVLAVVGLWYVVSHHLQAIMITLLTAGGIGSGLLVLYRRIPARIQGSVAHCAR